MIADKQGFKGRRFRYIYGPVPSWRIGSSLGIDLLSQREKVCSFDCIYCQLGETKDYSLKRGRYVSEKEIINELQSLPKDVQIDFLTFSGRGEPTLAKNLGNTIEAVKQVRTEQIAVITNSSTIAHEDVRQELALADLVIVKLDAPTQEVFETVNRPDKGIMLQAILEGIRKFREKYRGRLALQLMFMKENKETAEDIALIVKGIHPDEVQINTPLRPCGVEPLEKEELLRIKGLFDGLNVISVYETEKGVVKPISDKDTLKRRGKV
jgi:wyosine [tRNA(Phe)-imidazoG37] synthetase (radical SAM superfamily)